MKRLACMSRVSESVFAMSSAIGVRRVARGLDGGGLIIRVDDQIRLLQILCRGVVDVCLDRVAPRGTQHLKAPSRGSVLLLASASDVPLLCGRGRPTALRYPAGTSVPLRRMYLPLLVESSFDASLAASGSVP